MILLIFAVLGIAAGLLAGGWFRHCAEYPLRGVALPIGALLIKAGAAYLLTPQTGAVLICLLQYALIFGFLLINSKQVVWTLFVFAGSFLNFLTILLNGGCMPVSGTLLAAGSERARLLASGGIYAYMAVTPQTLLPFLGDVIRVGPKGMLLGFASAGDILLGAGIAILCFQMLRGKAAERAEE